MLNLPPRAPNAPPTINEKMIETGLISPSISPFTVVFAAATSPCMKNKPIAPSPETAKSPVIPPNNASLKTFQPLIPFPDKACVATDVNAEAAAPTRNAINKVSHK